MSAVSELNFLLKYLRPEKPQASPFLIQQYTSLCNQKSEGLRGDRPVNINYLQNNHINPLTIELALRRKFRRNELTLKLVALSAFLDCEDGSFVQRTGDLHFIRFYARSFWAILTSVPRMVLGLWMLRYHREI